eukprot:7328516-Prymnesium_polylepis.1
METKDLDGRAGEPLSWWRPVQIVVCQTAPPRAAPAARHVAAPPFTGSRRHLTRCCECRLFC